MDDQLLTDFILIYKIKNPQEKKANLKMNKKTKFKGKRLLINDE